jgi:fibronectin type 3 domain-containing protein
MPLGASITAGYPQGHGGYRVPLLSMLSSGGINITYVGSQTTYNPPDQPNLHHEGHPGFLIADVDGLVQNGIIQQYNPDTILLYIGTNNLDLNENTPWIPTDYTLLLNDIFAAKPTVRIIVSPLFVNSGYDQPSLDNFNIGYQVLDAQQHVVGYTGGLAQLVTAEQQQGRNITFNDNMRSALTLSDLLDGTHPNDAGYQKMATSWYAAIQAVTPGQLSNVAPTGPTGLVAVPVSGTEIDESWTRNSLTESAFSVDVSTSWDFSQGVTTWAAPAGSNHLAVTGLSPGTNYYFRVRATNSFGASANSLAATAATWPTGWAAADIGSPGQAGSSSFDGTTWMLKGGGSDIWSAPDQFQYAYQYVSGDASIVARVTSVMNTNYWAKAGVMFRDGTGAGAPYVALLQNPNDQVEMQWRDSTGAVSNWNGMQVGNTTIVKWVRLVRTGNTFVASYASIFGVPATTDWVPIVSHTLAMSAPTVGLAVTADNNSFLCTATFTGVTTTGTITVPAAPSGLTAVLNGNQINLNWTSNSTNQTGFKVERASNSGFTQNLILLTTTAANVTSYSDSAVSVGATYYYRVRATNSFGDSGNSNTASATVTGAPAAPSGLTALVNGSQVNLSWTSNSTNQTGFKVERATDSGFTQNLTLLTTTAANVTSYTDSAVTTGATYYYRVRATNANGDSPNSNSASVTLAPPAAPSGLTAATPSSSQVNLSWTSNSTNQTGFKVERATDNGFTQNLTLLATTAANTTTYTDTTVSGGATYFYRVRATNAFGDSPNSNTASVTLLPTGWASADIGSPGLAGSTSFDGTTWTVRGGGSDIWSAPDQFQYASQFVSGDASIIARVTSVQNTDAWAKAGVMFRDGTGAGAPYVALLQNPNDQVEMQWRDSTGAVSNWNGMQVGDAVNVKWVQLVRSGNTFTASYAATVGVPTASDWVLLGTHTLAMSAPTVGLAVTAVNNAALCTTTFSGVSTTGTNAPPAPPSGLGAVAMLGQVNLSWTSNSTNQTGFKIERSTDSSFTQNLILLTTTAASVTSYTDTAVSHGITYYYRVRATNAFGDSANSNTASATP